MFLHYWGNVMWLSWEARIPHLCNVRECYQWLHGLKPQAASSQCFNSWAFWGSAVFLDSCCGVMWPIEVPRDVYAQEFKRFHGLHHFTTDVRRGQVCVCFPPEVQNHLFHLFVAFSARLCTKYHPESLCTSALYPVSSLTGMSLITVVSPVNFVMLLDEYSSLQSCVYWQQRTGLST